MEIDKTKNANRLAFALLMWFTLSMTSFSQYIGQPVSSKEIFDEMDKAYYADPRLVSGELYKEPANVIYNSHPYYIDPEFKVGTVTMGNFTYDNLLLKYDIVSNCLVLNTSFLNDQAYNICLKTRDISEFKLGNRCFKKYSGNPNSTEDYYYEIVVDGKIDFVILKSKSLEIEEWISRNYFYKESISKYIVINGEFLKYEGPRSLYEIYPELESELRDFVSAQNIQKETSELKLELDLINYCNQLLDQSE